MRVIEESVVHEQTRTVGNSPMYRIDCQSAAAEALAEMEWALLDEIEG